MNLNWNVCVFANGIRGTARNHFCICNPAATYLQNYVLNETSTNVFTRWNVKQVRKGNAWKGQFLETPKWQCNANVRNGHVSETSYIRERGMNVQIYFRIDGLTGQHPYVSYQDTFWYYIYEKLNAVSTLQ